MSDAEKLEFEKQKFNYLKEKVDRNERMAFLLAEKEMDYSYLRLTVVIVILVVLVFYISCKFGFARPRPSTRVPNSAVPPNAKSVEVGNGAVNLGTEDSKTEEDRTAGAKVSQAPRSENFSPYISTSLPDLYRSDASFDSSVTHGDSEKRLESTINGISDQDYSNRDDYLFDQTHALITPYV